MSPPPEESLLDRLAALPDLEPTQQAQVRAWVSQVARGVAPPPRALVQRGVLTEAQLAFLIDAPGVTTIRAPLVGPLDGDRTDALTPSGGTVVDDRTDVLAPRALPVQSDPHATLPDGPVGQATEPGPPPPATAARPRADPGAQRYTLGRVLGEGGMGKVVLATDRQLRREVALKTLHQPQPELVARFVEEAQVTGQLEHPNIVPVHDLGTDGGGQPFLAMKRVKGRSLREVLEDEAGQDLDGATLARHLQAFIQVCHGVAYAHSRGVVHRDLKPDNIMVGEFGEVLVMDWGLAKVVGRDDTGVVSDRAEGGIDASMAGEVKGTPSYMPPEQARGDALDERADVYSLGAVLYHVLTGCRPFHADSVWELLRIVGDGTRVEPPRERAPGRAIPAELEAVVLRAMAPVAAERYGSVSELTADVQAFLAGRTLAAVDYSPLARALKWARRHRTAVAGGLATVLVAAVGLGFALTLRQRAITETRRREAARQRAAVAAHVEGLERELSAIFGELAGISAFAGSGDLDRVLPACVGFDARHGATLRRVAADDDFRTARPQLLARAERLSTELDTLRARALGAHARRTLTSAGEPRPEPGAIAQVEAAFARLQPHVAALPEIPLAALALWRVEAALADEDVRQAELWTARAYVDQPTAEATGRAFLRLAEQARTTRARGWAAMRLHLALSVFGDRHAALRPELLLGLARSLMDLGGGATPFAVDVPAAEMALRCVLQLVDPDGRLRPEVARVLPAARRSGLRQAAADLLFVLIQTTAWAGGPDVGDQGQRWRGPGAPAILHVDGLAQGGKGSGLLTTYDLEPPERPGADPPRLAVRRRVDLTAAIQQTGAPRRAVWRAYLARVLPGPGPPQVLVTARAGERGELVVLASLDDPRPILRHDVGANHVHEVAVGDLDGDGTVELVVSFGARVNGPTQVRVLGYDGARWRQVGDVYRGGPVSFLVWLRVCDLDGDGAAELLIHRGEWNHLTLEVHRLRAGRVVELDRRVVGIAEARIEPRPGGARIHLVARLGARERRILSILQPGKPPLHSRYEVLRFDGQRLVSEGVRVGGRLESPPYRRFAGPWRTAAGELVLALAIIAGEASRTEWWFIDPSGARPPRSLTVRDDSQLDGDATQLLALYPRVRAFRTLRRADLDAVSTELPVPRVPAEAQEVALASFLLKMGLAREAAAYARRVLERGPAEPGTWTRLTSLELAALEAAPDPVGLARRLDALTPHAALLADVEGAAGSLALRHQRVDVAARVLARWRRIGGIGEARRERLEAAADAWGTAQVQLTRRLVDADAERVMTEAGEQPTASRWVETALGSTAIERGADGPVWVCSPHPRAPRPAVTGAAPSRPAVVAGIPVVLEPGSYRVVLDLRIDDYILGETIGLGLWGLAAHPHPAAVRLRSWGGNDLASLELKSNTLRMRPRPLDALIGRWLRVEIRYLAPARELQLTLADATTRRVLASTRHRIAGVAGGTFLLGVFSWEDHAPARVRIRRIALFGAGRVLDVEDPALAPLLDRHQARALARIERERRAGRTSAAARALSTLATRAGLREEHVEAAWLASGADRARFVERLVAEKVAEPHVLAWLAGRAPVSGDDAAWAAVGAWLAATRHAGAEPAAIQAQLIRRIQTAQNALTIVDAALASWLVQTRPAPVARRISILCHVIAGRRGVGTRSLRRRAIDEIVAHPGAIRGIPGLTAQVLLSLHRRRAALKAAGPTPTGRLAGAVGEQRRRAQEADAALAAAQAEATRLGLPFPALPARGER